MKDIIMFLVKTVIACVAILLVSIVGYKYWYVNHFTPEERAMIEDVRRRVEAGEKFGEVKTTNAVSEVSRVLHERKKSYRESHRVSKAENARLKELSYNIGIVAETLWREARGEGRKGIEAVASVIWNRMKEKGISATAVCLEKGQFSCWKNERNVKEFTPWGRHNLLNMNPTEHEIWNYCVSLARVIVYGTFVPTLTANHYYNPSKCRPKWGRRMRCVKVIGNHRFGRI